MRSPSPPHLFCFRRPSASLHPLANPSRAIALLSNMYVGSFSCPCTSVCAQKHVRYDDRPNSICISLEVLFRLSMLSPSFSPALFFRSALHDSVSLPASLLCGYALVMSWSYGHHRRRRRIASASPFSASLVSMHASTREAHAKLSHRLFFHRHPPYLPLRLFMCR